MFSSYQTACTHRVQFSPLEKKYVPDKLDRVDQGTTNMAQPGAILCEEREPELIQPGERQIQAISSPLVSRRRLLQRGSYGVHCGGWKDKRKKA